MLSLIICSKYEQPDSRLLENLQSTVGCEYELIVLDNSRKKYSICQAYNEGVSRAKGDILCFMHEDVVFHTSGWGVRVAHYLADDEVGAIGAAGSPCVPDRLDWRFLHIGQNALLQGMSSIELQSLYYTYPLEKGRMERRGIAQVAILDGVWICMRKELFEHIRWDDETFSDFHLYDSDISMQINQFGKGLYVCYDVLIEHKSEGTYTHGFVDCQGRFTRKWAHMLPFYKGEIEESFDLEPLQREGERRCAARLEEDRKKLEVLSHIRSNNADLLTAEDRKYMSASAFLVRRRIIKDKHQSDEYAWMVVKNFKSQSYRYLKVSLLFKYLWYRVLCRSKLVSYI